MADSKNLILAVVLSLVVLIGWQYFVAGPEIERARQQQISQQVEPAPAAPGAQPGAIPDRAPGEAPIGVAPTTVAPAPTAAAPVPALSRAEALAQSPRVEIATPRVSGSINLRGGRIDDLQPQRLP